MGNQETKLKALKEANERLQKAKDKLGEANIGLYSDPYEVEFLQKELEAAELYLRKVESLIGLP